MTKIEKDEFCFRYLEWFKSDPPFSINGIMGSWSSYWKDGTAIGQSIRETCPPETWDHIDKICAEINNGNDQNRKG